METADGQRLINQMEIKTEAPSGKGSQYYPLRIKETILSKAANT